MNIKIVRYGFANIYRSTRGEGTREISRHIWDQREEAEGVGRLHENYVATVPVQWEESCLCSSCL